MLPNVVELKSHTRSSYNPHQLYIIVSARVVSSEISGGKFPEIYSVLYMFVSPPLKLRPYGGIEMCVLLLLLLLLFS